MIGGIFGNFIGGVLWGVGASIAGRVAASNGDASLHDLTKGAVKGYLAAAERIQTLAEDARQGFEGVIAEVERERGSGGSSSEAAQ